MYWGISGSVFLLLCLAYRVYFVGIRGEAAEALCGPNLHARLDVLFEPYVGQPLNEASRRALEEEADVLFRDIMTGVGLVRADWRLVVEVDELLGPVPKVQGPGGERLHLAEFEQRVRDGQLDLSKH